MSENPLGYHERIVYEARIGQVLCQAITYVKPGDAWFDPAETHIYLRGEDIAEALEPIQWLRVQRAFREALERRAAQAKPADHFPDASNMVAHAGAAA